MDLNGGLNIVCCEAVMELAKYPGAKGDHAHRRIFHTGNCHAAVLDRCRNACGIVVDNEAHEIGIMHSEVKYSSRTSRGIGQAPALQVNR